MVKHMNDKHSNDFYNLPVSDRITRLRDNYMNCPMIVKKLSYGKSQRQRILFMEGWGKYGYLYTAYLRRSYAEAYVIEHMRPVIDADELIVGQPDFTPLTKEEKNRLNVLSNAMLMSQKSPGITGHMSLDFEKLIKVGVYGLIDEVKNCKSGLDLNIPENIAKNEFYEGCINELNALLILEKRYADHARELAKSADGIKAEELIEIAGILDKVPAHPASSLREALQSMHFYSFNLWSLYQAGRPDQYLLPYYEDDIKSGILTKEGAQELIDCFCLLYSTYITSHSSIGFMIGGRDRSGNPVENELTWMFLTSIGHTRMADPSIGLCITDETSDELLGYAVELLAKGYTHPALYNDNAITASLLKYGISPEDSHDYIHSACVEITPCARSGIWVVSPYHNLAKMLLEVIHAPKEFNSLDEILNDFEILLRQKIFEGNYIKNTMQLERSRNGGEPLRVSCLVHDCIRRGKSINEGGAIYNQIMPNFMGMPNLVDSLSAIQSLVFDAKELTLNEFIEILDNNYEKHEALRQRILNKVPHYGNNEEFTDSLAKRITEMIVRNCKGINTFKGSILIPGLFTFSEHVKHGKETPATPDGRFAGYPLADGSSPVQGRDIKGPTASLLSVTAWDHSPFIGGIAVNTKLSKEYMTDKYKNNIMALIKTFIDHGGFELQINAVDTDTLRKALNDPESYRDLVVRIGGYSDYFVTLSREMQQEIIDRSVQVV